jgi:hypothetical protein
MISLNVVIWDESNVIDRCVKSAKKYVDEVVFMVDRSCRFTDRLIKYADKIVIGDLTGTIVEHHRNELIEASSNEWILVLDPDEFITPQLGHDLLTMCNSLGGWYLPRFNITYNNGYELMVGEDFPDWNLRFFRSEARYGGTIYEDQLSLSKVDSPLGLTDTAKYDGQGLIIHDKTYEDIEEVERTVELYKQWETE